MVKYMIIAKLISSTKEKYEKHKDTERFFFNSNGTATLICKNTKKTILNTPVIINFNFFKNILIINTLNGFFSFEFLNGIPDLKTEKQIVKLLLNN